MAADQRPLSLWAVASFGTSIAICPPLCLIGPLLGFAALIQLRSGAYRGRALAILGIVIGLGASGGWSTFAFWWNANARGPMLNGPVAALQAGLGGDVASFEDAFLPGSPDATAFIDEVRARYGDVQSSGIVDAELLGPTPETGRVRRIPYDFTFTTGIVRAEAELVVFGEGVIPGVVLEWRRLDFYHEDGTLAMSYPAAR